MPELFQSFQLRCQTSKQRSYLGYLVQSAFQPSSPSLPSVSPFTPQALSTQTWGGSCLPPGESLATAQLSGMLARYGWDPAGLCPPWAQHPPRPVGPQVLPASLREILSPHVGLGHCLGSPCWPRQPAGAICSCSISPRSWQLPPDPLPPPSD